MTVEIRSLVIRADFSKDEETGRSDDEGFLEALAIAEQRIRQDVAEMITEAFRRREER